MNESVQKPLGHQSRGRRSLCNWVMGVFVTFESGNLSRTVTHIAETELFTRMLYYYKGNMLLLSSAALYISEFSLSVLSSSSLLSTLRAYL